SDIHGQTADVFERFESAINNLREKVALTDLPFTELPLSQAPLPELRDYLIDTLACLDDYQTARNSVAACSIAGLSVTTSTMIEVLNKSAALMAKATEIG